MTADWLKPRTASRNPTISDLILVFINKSRSGETGLLNFFHSLQKEAPVILRRICHESFGALAPMKKATWRVAS